MSEDKTENTTVPLEEAPKEPVVQPAARKAVQWVTRSHPLNKKS